MPSDTFAAGIEAAARVAEGHNAATQVIAATIRRLTPTDTDTAIPAGEGRTFAEPEHQEAYDQLRRMRPDVEEYRSMGGGGNAYAVGYTAPQYPPYLFPKGSRAYAHWAAGVDNARDDAAASPKPSTDTPVDPGVEGVERALAGLFKLEVFAEGDDLRRVRDAITVLRALAAKPTAGMDAGEEEDA